MDKICRRHRLFTTFYLLQCFRFTRWLVDSNNYIQQNSFIRTPKSLPRGICKHRVLMIVHRYIFTDNHRTTVWLFTYMQATKLVWSLENPVDLLYNVRIKCHICYFLYYKMFNETKFVFLLLFLMERSEEYVLQIDNWTVSNVVLTDWFAWKNRDDTVIFVTICITVMNQVRSITDKLCLHMMVII